MKWMHLITLGVCALFILSCAVPVYGKGGTGQQPSQAKWTPKQLQFFKKDVLPILVKHCYRCHSHTSKRSRGGLVFDSRTAVLEGGERGPAIVPGDPKKSLLIKAIQHTDPLFQMPPKKKLPKQEIDVLVRWIRMGAPDPRKSVVTVAKTGKYQGGKNWWSFQPVRQPEFPRVRNDRWPNNAVDLFILNRLETERMKPAPPADPRVLVRRITFDLIGLPPTPKEIDSFLQDYKTQSQAAVEKLVDRLLASPHYGERWGRHWLDVVRYADTAGCNSDFPIPEAYRYRNYVIDSFNADKPYDEFLREQIAGDLLPAKNDKQRFQQIIATGYLALSRRFSSLGEEFHLTLDDTIDNVGKAILGLSLSCARCHDHKFDPIPQEDYYALYGIFESTRYAFPGTEIYRHREDHVPLVSKRRLKELRLYLQRMEKLDFEIFRVRSRVTKLDTGKEKNAANGRWRKLQRQRDDLVKKLPKFDMAYAVRDWPANPTRKRNEEDLNAGKAGETGNARLHIKGNRENLGKEIPRGFLTILGGQKVPATEKGSGRLDLAKWLTDPKNPLTARVMVNRVWQHHFGKGLVRTPDDFGSRGTKPTHPELLDYLTSYFVNNGWSIKKMHRLIVLSRTYQMSCIENSELSSKDPDNRYLWTFNRRRISAEEMRDAILAVSGNLDRTRGGPHPFPAEWKWRYSQHRPFVANYPSRRRSIYLMQQRIRLHPYLGIFDGADTNVATGKRKVSTSPLQALFVLNSEFMHEQSRVFADRMMRTESSQKKRIDLAFRLTMGRHATAAEINEAKDYLQAVGSALKRSGVSLDRRTREAWASYLRVLLSSNEFVFVD